MSDEQVTGAAPSVSEDQQSPSPAPARSAPEPDQQRQEVARKFFQRALGREPKNAEPSPTADEKASRQQNDGTEPAFEPPKSRAELDRIVQAETDRREAKRARDAEAKAKRDQERWELDNDPNAVIERKRQEFEQQETHAQALQATAAIAQDLQTKYDRAVLDPMFLELPESAQQSILKAHPFQGDTLKHRQDITKATLTALKKQYKAEGAAEAEAKLRRNPAILKPLLADLRDETDEPVTVSGSTSNGPVRDMNVWIRRGLGRRY